MEDGQIEEAIEAFGGHAQVLLSKMDQYKGDKKKIDAINSDLEMINTFLSDLRLSSLDKHTNNFEPLSTRKEALEKELNRYPQIARDTITRMITYKFPNLMFSDIVGHQEAKDVLLRAMVNPIKRGSLWDEKSRTTGILLFGKYTKFK